MPRPAVARCMTGEAGSGTAIGVAVLFPVLMMVIVLLQALTASSRTEHGLQVAADRAAQTASLCCVRVGDPNVRDPDHEDFGAAGRARQVLEQYVYIVSDSGPRKLSQRVACVNADAVTDARVSFYDNSGAEVPADPNAAGAAQERVPPGGRAEVSVTCELDAGRLGGFVAGTAVQRIAVGVAAVDPYRQRWEPLGDP